MKKNVWLLAVCQAMLNSGNSLLIATAALVGLKLAPDKALATLPLAAQFLASMITTMPASFLMKRIGRQAGFLIGTGAGLVGAGIAAWAIVQGSFALFIFAAALFGVYNGFGTYYRFAAADAATPDYKPAAISYVMAGGVVAAFIGPNLANWAKAWIPAADFAGSYLSLLAVVALSALALLFVRIPRQPEQQRHETGRPLSVIAAQPQTAVAMLGAAIGFGVMVFVMTATPLAMHAHHHGFGDTAFVIEWHVLGMFAPSFVTGHLIKRFGALNVMLAGALLTAGCVVVNLLGTSVSHFWTALVLLGIGWNFLFVGGTALLTQTYTEAEKAKTQGLNDFLVFTVITIASLSAGAIQHHLGWRLVNLGVIPLIAIVALAIGWLMLKRRAAPVPA
jgi:MFS family permease